MKKKIVGYMPERLWDVNAIKIDIDGAALSNSKVKLPEGCIGITLIFKTKKAAKKYLGEDVLLTTIELENAK